MGALVLTAVRSAPSISVGQVTTSVSGMSGSIKIPVSIKDPGPLALSGISVAVSVYNGSGSLLFQGGGGPVSVPSGSTAKLPVAVSFNLSQLPNSTLQELATTNENLNVRATLLGSIPPFAGLNGTVDSTLPWGAPVENFSAGSPQVVPINSSYVSVSVPISFTNNNSYISVSGVGSIQVLDHNGKNVGSGTLDINAAPRTRFATNGKLTIALPSNMQGLLFNDTNLQYTANVNFRSNGISLFSLSQPVTLNWKAPLSNLVIGNPTIHPYNSTYLQASIPVSFDNRNDYVDISTNLHARILNGSSPIGSGTIAVNAKHNTNFSGNLVAYIALDNLSMNTLLFNDSTIQLRSILVGSYSGASFSFDQNVSLQWNAPMHNLLFGSLSATPYNSTFAAFSLPFNFTDGSSYLSLNATLDGAVLGPSSAQIGTINNFALHANTQSPFSGVLTGYIETSSLSQHPITLRLLIHTTFGNFEKDVSVNG